MTVLGLTAIVWPIAGLATGEPGGWGFLVLGLPLLVVGIGALRGVRLMRIVGPLGAFCCAGLLAYIATTPLRDVSPPPGVPDTRSVEPESMLVGFMFLASALLLTVGAPDRRS